MSDDGCFLVRKVLQQAGLFGLWRGCWPNVGRAALVNLGDLSTYDSVKRNILDNTNLEDNTLTHTMSSACAGSVLINSNNHEIFYRTHRG